MNKEVLQMILTKGVGDVIIKKYLSFMCVNKKENYQFEAILKNIGIKVDTINAIIDNFDNAMDLLAKLNSQDIELITENSLDYPQYLKIMLKEKCPPCLFIKGNKALLNQNSVGFCGSRDASSKGIGITENCAKQLVEKNIIITSGYASGADLAAHKSALVNGGRTIFVLAEGIFHHRIKREIKEYLTQENHLFVSQFMPSMTWNAGNAMKRNSTIIGLSQAMMLIESKLKGGTFEAGKEALRVKCPLFVIDFAKPEVSAEANPYFIDKGGIPIRGKDGSPNMEKVFSVLMEDNRVNEKNKVVQSSFFDEKD